jgi:hypothetical protein
MRPNPIAPPMTTLHTKEEDFLSRPFLRPKFVTGLIGLLILCISFLRSSNLPETDLIWGARNGNDILSAGKVDVFIPDVWNLQTLGEIWSPNSWLWNVLLGVFYAAFGTAGFMWITFLTNILLYGALWMFLRQIHIPAHWQVPVILITWYIINNYANGRSNIVDILLLFVFMVAAHRMSRVPSWRRQTAAYAVLSFLFSMLWINLHLTGVIVVIIFPVIIYMLNHKETFWHKMRLAAPAGIAALAGLFVSPFGVDALFKVLLVQNESDDFFTEWAGVFFRDRVDFPTIMALLVAIPVLWFALKNRQFLYSLAVLVLAYEAFNTIRISMYLTPVLIVGLVLIPSWKVPYRKLWDAALIMMVASFSVLTALTIVGVTKDINSILPVDPDIFKALPENARVASTAEVGGELILYRPDVLVTIDGRNDLLGKERYATAIDIMYFSEKDELETWLTKLSVDTVLVVPDEEFMFEDTITNMREIGWVEEQVGPAHMFLDPDVHEEE